MASTFRWRKVFLRGKLAVLLLASCASAQAIVYSNAINDSSWQAKSTVFSCQLEHSIPFYGDAVFRTRAGEASGFYLRAKTSRFKAGQAKIIAASPVWAAEKRRQELATVGLKQGKRPLWLGSAVAELMLAKLSEGLEVELERPAWYDTNGEAARLAMSTIGFTDAYASYLGCLSSLIPQNFYQLQRTSLLFAAGENEDLPLSITQKLDNILQLVKHDSKIRTFYVDGHTDSVGDRDENLALSKVRAELISQYLERRGIPKDWIKVRWHGERYPVKSNATAAGRAKNRRVTVRLERVEEIEVLPLAAAP